MKFLTKEWYQAMQNSGLGSLKVDPEAERFSDAYYRKLYREQKNEWLHSRKEVCCLLDEPFDEKKEKSRFDSIVWHEKQRYAAILPENILNDVADIRVLALGYCTQEVKEKIKTFAKQCRDQVENTWYAYEKYEKVTFAQNRPEFLDRFHFHDNFVASMQKCGDDYHLLFEKDEEDTEDVKKIIFKDVWEFQKEKRLAGAWWLYEEVHRTEDGYEVCVLLDKNGVFELSIKCDDVVLE